MDDFLHNLRSGKLKQTDRGRRDYTDYKGPQRRASNERRRTDYYTKVTNENFALIKETLDVLVDCQKRVADVMVEREKTEARIAGALETIATLIGRHLGVEDVISQPKIADDVKDEGGVDSLIIAAEPVGNRADDEEISAEDQPDLIEIIATMRDAGDSWEKIARHFDEQKIPTISGKGKWRGPAVKKFWDASA
jgi:iron-sulfur cluster repair protein YtfE (RIC family)